MTFDGKTAYLYLKEGKKVRARTWYWGKFVKMKNRAITDEKGELFPISYFLEGKTLFWEEYSEKDHGLIEHEKIGSNMENSGGCGEQGFI